MVDCNIILLFKKNKLTDAEEFEAILATQDLLRFDGEVNFDDYLQDKESGLCTVFDMCIACWCTVYHIFHDISDLLFEFINNSIEFISDSI